MQFFPLEVVCFVCVCVCFNLFDSVYLFIYFTSFLFARSLIVVDFFISSVSLARHTHVVFVTNLST